MDVGVIDLPEGIGFRFSKLEIDAAKGNSRLQAQVEMISKP